MPDSRFFDCAGPLSLERIAEISGAALHEAASPALSVQGVASLDQAGPQELSFLDNVKYREQFRSTKAGACFVHPDYAPEAPEGVSLLLSPHPYKSYALAAQALYPETVPELLISDKAVIHETAKMGPGCIIEPGAVVGRNVELGRNVRVGANAVLSHCLIGDYTRLYPGVCVGQDGFGFAIDPKGHVKVPQLGRVVIGEHVEIGANTTIDRGAGPDTEIGQGTWIDNLVQIGHNVKIGRGCIIVAQVGISGSTVIEDFVAIGGQGGIAGHLHIGRGARIAAQSGVMRDIPAGEEHMGSPALPIRQYMKQVAFLRRLGKKDGAV